MLDLKSQPGIEAVRRLVQRSDVLVEIHPPGVTEKLGITWEALREINPHLIYCSISGFGQQGPLRDFPAIEWSVQAMSGMSAGYLGDEGDGAQLGLGVLDPFSGYVAFSAILAALLQRQHTGQGQHIDASMLDAALLLMAPRVASGSDSASGGRHGSAADNGPLPCSGSAPLRWSVAPQVVREPVQDHRCRGAAGRPALRRPANAGGQRGRADCGN